MKTLANTMSSIDMIRASLDVQLTNYLEEIKEEDFSLSDSTAIFSLKSFE